MTTERPLRFWAIGVWLLAAAAAVRHASGYFFLSDDFSLIGEATKYATGDMIAAPLFLFYRPFVFLVIRGEAQFFGWHAPAGYAAMSLLLHGCAAWLVLTLAGRVGLSSRAALVAATLFALSPWAAESYLWVSSHFDLLSTAGVLGCLCLGLSAVTAKSTVRSVAHGTLALSLGLMGLFSKESALVLPALATLPLVTRTVAADGAAERKRGIAFIGLTAVAVLAYLWARYSAIARSNPEGSAFETAYGMPDVLFGQAPLASNFVAYVRAMISWPYPGVSGGAGSPEAIVWITACACLGLAAIAFRSAPRQATLAVLGFTASLIPVLWTTVQPGTSAGGRYLYAPGAWFCILLAAGVDRLVTSRADAGRRLERAAGYGTLALLAGLMLVSVSFQASAWRIATALSRASVEQFGAILQKGVPKILVANLPFASTEGPHLLKNYAFGYYFAGQSVPEVRSRRMTVSLTGARPKFVAWVDQAAGVPDPDEELLYLDLPIEAIPPLWSVQPEKISLFVSVDARRHSESRVTLNVPETLGPWRVDTGDSSPFDVEPRRGRGAATISLVPHGVPADSDRTVTVSVVTDDSRRHVLATLTVRMKVVPATNASPPHGWLDRPEEPVVLGSDPVVFQGWAVDEMGLSRVWGEVVDALGTRHQMGEALRGGERPDVSALHPDAHDLFNAGWLLAIDPGLLRSWPRPLSVEIWAEDIDGLRTRIGVRTIR